MTRKKLHSPEKVDDAVDQLISVTIEWLCLQSHTTQQLVLNAERIKALQRLQKLMRKELKSEVGNGERVWQVVNTIIASVTHYILERMSDSIQYKLCREQGENNLCSRLHSGRIGI
jgi:hypothetical protein